MTQIKKIQKETYSSRFPFARSKSDFASKNRAGFEIQKYFTAVSQILWISDLNGFVTFFNQQWWQYTGLNSSSYESHDAIECLHPDDRLRVTENWLKTFSHGTPFDLQFRLRAKNAEYEWFRGVLNPIRDDQGEIREWLGIATNIEAQKRLEQESHLFFEATPSFVWKTSLRGQIQYSNASFLKFIGCSIEDLNKKGWSSILHPDDYFDLIKKWIEANQLGTILEARFRLRRMDGKYRWLASRAFPVRDTVERTVSWITVASDIQDSIDAQNQIKYGNRRFNLALSVSGIGAWEWDIQLNRVVADHKTCDLFGIERDSAVYTSEDFFSLIAPEDFDRVFSQIQEALRWSKDYSVEFRVISSQHRGAHWLRCMGCVVTDVSNRERKVLGMVIDVSVQKNSPKLIQLDENRFDKESRYRPFFEQSSLPMEIYSVTGVPLEVNSAWEKLFATSRDQLRNYNILQDSNIEQSGIRPYLLRALDGESTKIPAFYFDPAKIGKVGRARWIEGVFFPIKNEFGKVDELGVCLEDVTERELTDQRLKKSNELLEKAVIAKQELLNICGHELKSPLSSLKLRTQIAQRQIARGDLTVYEPERVQILLSRYEDQVDRLNQIVDDMFDLTRVTSGRLTLKLEKVDLSQLTLDVLERLSDQLAVAGCQVSTSLSPDAIGFWDRFRIEQALVNLITNAMRYGKGRPISVEVIHSDAYAFLSLRDQGFGIAPENHERIFERFERATSANEMSGLGLGLYIVKEILKAHEGSIRVESELGKGSKFIIKLPLRDSLTRDR